MDDNSPAPVAPSINLPTEEVAEEVIQDDVKLAQAGLHPVFGVIEQDYLDEITRVSMVTNVSADLPAVEFKAEVLANAKYAIFLTNQLERVRDAIKQGKGTK